MAKLDTKQNFSIPSSDSDRDKILLLAVKELAEKVGGNITLNQLLAKTDNLTYEEIMASTDLTGKVASASALKDTLIVPKYSDSNNIAVTELTTVGGTWTAPSNGILRIYGVKDKDDITSEITIKINNDGNSDIRYKVLGSSVFYNTQYIPIKKGDVLETFTFTNIYSGGTPRFYPSV